MASKWPPLKDADLLTMANTASGIISTDFAALGLSSLQATTLATKVSSYQSSYTLAKAPTTRTPTNIADMRDAKAALVANLRDLNRYVQANKALTDGQKLAIQFPVYATRAPINPPTGWPIVTAESIGPWLMFVKLLQADTTRRGWPVGVNAAEIYTYHGSLPLPTDVEGWSYMGSTSKPTAKIALNPAIPAGTTIYVTAVWRNPRQALGTLAPAVSLQITGGVGGTAGGMKLTETTPMKDAA